MVTKYDLVVLGLLVRDLERPAEGAMPQEFEAGRVFAARLLSPQIRNVTIAVESFAGVAFEPGADVTNIFTI